ncbi:MAG: dihydroorotate dehydrogenase electron transfer subunit [Paludibacteraceae bacterium]|nr:dihydroorotate dehydrogenase electron transfer subunit [Paludibacteraceae bacterium]
MKQIIDTFIRETKRLNDRNILLRLMAEVALPHLQAGQFVEVQVSAPNVFLRRPISVHFYCAEKNELWLLVQLVGKATHEMALLKEGDKLNLVLPLGKPFSIPTAAAQRLLLVGGGVGVAPLLYLGSTLKEQGHHVTFLLGGRTKGDLLQLDEFQKYGEVYVTTEDASLGEGGFVTQHSLLQNETFDFIYTCGPTPMMQAVARYAQQKGIECEVSLENKMACGVGACLCCVTDTKEGHKCVCTEGPVFNIKDLKW